MYIMQNTYYAHSFDQYNPTDSSPCTLQQTHSCILAASTIMHLPDSHQYNLTTRATRRLSNVVKHDVAYISTAIGSSQWPRALQDNVSLMSHTHTHTHTHSQWPRALQDNVTLMSHTHTHSAMTPPVVGRGPRWHPGSARTRTLSPQQGLSI